MKKFLLLGALLCVGCRTQIPVVVQKPVEAPRQTTCAVRDYGSAVNLPSGSVDLGRVEIPRQEEEQDTYTMLNQKVCTLGGNAVTGIRWEVELGLPKPRALSGNAWKLP